MPASNLYEPLGSVLVVPSLQTSWVKLLENCMVQAGLLIVPLIVKLTPLNAQALTQLLKNTTNPAYWGPSGAGAGGFHDVDRAAVHDVRRRRGAAVGREAAGDGEAAVAAHEVGDDAARRRQIGVHRRAPAGHVLAAHRPGAAPGPSGAAAIARRRRALAAAANCRGRQP